MKATLLICCALLLNHFGYAQTSSTYTGALTTTNPTESGQQPARDAVPSTCSMPKSFFPSKNSKGEVVEFSGLPYNSYIITNTTGSSTCVTVTYTPTCPTSDANNTFATAYMDSFNPNDSKQNYLADIGASPNQTVPAPFSFTVAANQTFVIVVNGLSSTATCDNYTLNVTLGTPLPVELSSFTGRATTAGNSLAWATASELHNARFVVERSADGLQFSALGEVAGAGTTLQPRRYAYLDAQPLPLSYYRLRQVDENGSVQFSPVVVVRASGSVFTFAPNPVASQATFYCPAAATLNVRDALGRLCQVLHLVAGSQQVALDALPAGVYSLTDDATHQTTRLVKGE